MGWFDFGRTPHALPVDLQDIPLFPLGTLLLPGGQLGLQLFEQRYLDMAAACLRSESAFGICLIADGEEVGKAAKPHPVGTLAEIVDWDMEQLGILKIRVNGGPRFRILETTVGETQLLNGRVEIIRDGTPLPFPSERQRLRPLLQRILKEYGERIPQPHAADDPAWVSFRLIEVMPIPNLAKQKLLELDDPLIRLELIEQYLEQRKLLD